MNFFDQAGVLHWEVDKIPEQSFLNTAGWKYIIPQLYKKYPNDDMRLNISINSPPLISLAIDNIQATILLDMIIEVVDNGEMIPVACITVVWHVFFCYIYFLKSKTCDELGFRWIIHESLRPAICNRKLGPQDFWKS